MNFSSKRAGIVASFFLAICCFLASTPSVAAATWTPSTSDENGDNSPAVCNGAIVTGLKCTGRYCDNVSLQCGDGIRTQSETWSPQFSEENSDGYVCPDQQLVAGVRCSGRYCDNMSVKCVNAPDVRGQSCYWKPASSEENGGENIFGAGTFLKGLRCRGKYCDSLEAYVCRSEAVCESDECKVEQAKKFAPVMKFDNSQFLPNKCFPSDAGTYWEARKSGNKDRICNESPESLTSGQIPIYYAYEDCSGDSTVIMYWFFYGFQDTCSPGLGSHNADWERIAVKITGGRVERVMYFQHAGHYTKEPDHFPMEGDTHPVVYIGKNSHGSYHDTGGSGSCLYFEDYRNPGDKNYTLHAADNLVALHDDDAAPEWMRSKSADNFDGIPGPLNRGINLCSMVGCQGKDFKIGAALCFGECGCSKSDIGDAPF